VKNHCKYLLFFFITLFLILSPFTVFASKCEERYPDDGACITEGECPEETSEDGEEGLCDGTAKCCHRFAAPPEVTLQVPIFGLTKARDLPEYIRAVFKYGIVVIILLSILGVMFGGFRWILAGGNVAQIKDAKKYIWSAITGLILALLSYTILLTVGIDVANLHAPKVKFIQVEEDESIYIFDAPGAPGTYPAVGGSCFPVVGGGTNLYNFGDRRFSGDNYRCHAGVDVLTKAADQGEIIAIADGEVLNIYRFTGCKDGWGAKKEGKTASNRGSVNAVIIYHPELGVTVNYGEIDQGKTWVKKGETVTAGQGLGYATYCGMLHLEIYQGKVWSNSSWYPKRAIPKQSNVCRNAADIWALKPSKLMDPSNTLKNLPRCD